MRQSSVVDPHLVQKCRIQIVNMHRVFNDVITVVIGLAVDKTRANAAAS